MRKKKHTEPFLSNRQLSEKEFSELIETVNLLIDQSSKYFKRNKPKLAGKKRIKTYLPIQDKVARNLKAPCMAPCFGTFAFHILRFACSHTSGFWMV